MRYNPNIHTPSALQAQLDIIREDNPDLRVMGSFGRAVLFEHYIDDPYYEFNARHQDPLHKYGIEARDIDVIGVNPDNLEPSSFHVDYRSFNNSHVRFHRETNDNWTIISETRGYSHELPAEVIEPITGESVFGIRTVTLPLLTHIALNQVKGPLRKQDNAAHAKLLYLAERNSMDHEPFEVLQRLLAINPKGLHVFFQHIIGIIPERAMSAIPHTKLPHWHQ